MAKKHLFTIVVFLFILFVYFIIKNNLNKNVDTNQSKQIVQSSSPAPSQALLPQKKGIFIPYWALEQDNVIKKYDEYYYFGVTPMKDGTIEEEQGKNNIELLDTLQMGKTTLVVRMMDKDVSDILLKSVETQKKFVNELIRILDKTKMKGVALDMEIPFSLDRDKPAQITNFVQQICSSIKSDYKTCNLIVYGDTFYRKRPYDMKELGKIVDTVLVMAYDFHKPMGESGPNFSFEGRKKYGYDFKNMLEDFTSSVSRDKLVIVFGMYGYDWTLNEQGTPLKSAQTFTLKQITNKILNGEFAYSQNSEGSAREKSITYKDAEGNTHVLWYEDEESVAIKMEYLKSQSVSRVAFWANGYF